MKMRVEKKLPFQICVVAQGFSKYLKGQIMFQCKHIGKDFGDGMTINELNKSDASIFYLLRGDINIPHSSMIKTCWETLVTCL